MITPYYSSLKKSARELRKNQTEAETIFWQCVRNRKVLGYKFIRQKPIFSYIVDFYCHELGLIIEIDGDVHLKQQESDDLRERDLKAFGLTVIRYSNEQVLRQFPEVLKHLKISITSLSKLPSRDSERGRG